MSVCKYHSSESIHGAIFNLASFKGILQGASTHRVRDFVIVVGVYVLHNESGSLLLPDLIIQIVLDVARYESVGRFGVVEQQVSGAQNLKSTSVIK